MPVRLSTGIFFNPSSMKNLFTLSLAFCCFYLPVFAQSLTGAQLLEKSIQYHDPEQKWASASLQLQLLEKRPGAPDRQTIIHLDLPKDFFRLEQWRGEDHIIRQVSETTCLHQLNGSENISEQDNQKYQFDCQRTKRIRNYYTYLWGLPMKLKDKGTIIDKEVQNTQFEGKDCYAIKVTYDPEVGADTWYFYFDKTTFALIGYRFYHDEGQNDGEYITLEGEEILNGFRLPKTRKWFVNKDDEFLGEDILQKD